MARRTPTQHPPMPRCEGDPKYIFAFCALKADAAASRVEALARAADKQGAASTAEALWAAFGALHRDKTEDLGRARKYGQLLFCWHGTRATEVAA